ncbi:hypothetical protein FHZ98_13890 [Listeria monocytogenes]|nr:hypothetical protein [Listeria monocytogenes]
MNNLHIAVGDVVHVKGYEALYYIDIINIHNIETSDLKWVEVELDLTGVYGEYNFAYLEDVTLVCRAKHAKEYLRTGTLTPDMLTANKEAPSLTTQAATIDELLDAAIEAQELYEQTGVSLFQSQEKAAYELIKNLTEMSE